MSRWGIVLLCVLLGLYLCRGLLVGDNALELLPDETVKTDLGLLQEMGLVDRIFITVSAQTADKEHPGASSSELLTSVDRLVKALAASNEFTFVLGRLPAGYEQKLFLSLGPMLPVLLGPADYERLHEKTTPAGLAAALENDFRILNSPAGFALKEQIQRDPLGITALVLEKLKHFRSELSMDLVDGYFLSKDRSSCLVVAQSRLSLTDSEQAGRVERLLQNIFAKELGQGISAGIVGSLPHTLANSNTIKRDLQVLLPVASVLLLVLLLVGLRSLRGILVLGVVFLAAPPAIGVTGLIYSPLSRMALGFGIVLLGIAVDFAIHLYLALTEGEGSRAERLRRVRQPVVFATLTTLAVLVVLLFSAVPSQRQMATLAIAGVGFAVLFAWLLIPTLTGLKDNTGKVKGAEENNRITAGGGSVTGKIALALWLCLLLAGIYAWPHLHYNGDLRGLDVPDKQVLQEEARFRNIWGDKGEQAFVIAQAASLDQLFDVNSAVYEELTSLKVGSFQSVAPLFPGPVTQQRNLTAWKTFWAERIGRFPGDFAAVAENIGFSPTAFAPFFFFLAAEHNLVPTRDLEGSALAPLLKSMLSATEPRVGVTPRFLALTTVGLTEDSDLAALRAGLDKIPGVSLLANVTWRSRVETLLRHDIFRLSLAAACAILVLVWLQFHRLRAVVAVVAPVISALSAMIVYAWLTGSSLNMMHLIMGIMVIGLSVDYGIFIVCAAHGAGGGHSWKAVTICALSSLVGFGVLAFAAHPALHSLGITVLVGIGMAWPTALWVSPVLLGGRK